MRVAFFTVEEAIPEKKQEKKSKKKAKYVFCSKSLVGNILKMFNVGERACNILQKYLR